LGCRLGVAVLVPMLVVMVVTVAVAMFLSSSRRHQWLLLANSAMTDA
jgi:4-amino-4-deoxy-L-arabinose transferase-like glycosyltransferase